MVPNWTSKYVARRDHIRSLRSDQQGDMCMVLPMYLHLIGAPPIRNHHRPTERQMMDTRVKDLLASGVPPKGLEARAFTFGGTEGSMLGRKGWFDAVLKRLDAGKRGMV